MKTVMRLDKYLADMGLGTRSEVKERIRRGHITVNGAAVRTADLKVDTLADTVCCDGAPVGYTHFEYYMLNKPAGVISATDDKKTETVIDLIKSKKRRDLFPVGRLDKDTEGLLLITNDGALAHQLLSPKKHVPKVYYARVAGQVTQADVERFAAGLVVDETLTAMPATLTILAVQETAEAAGLSTTDAAAGAVGLSAADAAAESAGINTADTAAESAGLRTADAAAESAGLSIADAAAGAPAGIPQMTAVSEITLEIHEGKFHQVKRMFEAVGKEVIYLKRLSMGPLALDEALKPGQYRELSAAELDMLRNIAPAGAGQTTVAQPTGETLSAGTQPLPENSRISEVSRLSESSVKSLVDHAGAIIFDMDGTLIDSMWVWEDIDREYLARFDLDMPEALQEAIAGISITQTAIYFKETFGIGDSIEKIIGDWDEMAYDKYSHEIPLKPGTREFLQKLSARGMRLAIATSSSRRLTEAVLAAHHIRDYFDVVLTGEDIHKGKPDPDVYLEAAKRLGVPADQCLVFEDIPYGIMAAKNAHMTCIAVEDDFSAADREEKRRLADGYIQDYFEITGADRR